MPSGLSLMLPTGSMLTWTSLLTLTGLGGEVTDTVGTARVLAAPHELQRKLNEKSMMCLTCLIALGVDSVSQGRGLERRHLTQSGDRDDDRPRVFADYAYPSGDSTPLLVAEDRRTGMTFAAAVPMKGGGDPHAARLLAKLIDGLGCQEVYCKNRRRAKHL